MSETSRDKPDTENVVEAQEQKPTRRWLPQNGMARRLIIWGTITTFLTGAAGMVVAIKTLWPYRPVMAIEMKSHAKADMAERKELEARTEKKIQTCLDAIRHLREERNEELKRQNKMLRQALSNMGGSP